jgi:peroxiredoxin Q/BCP
MSDQRLAAGDPAPSFRRTDQDGTEIELADYAGKSLVIYFYPKAFTPGCTTESCDFRDRYEAFTAAGYEIVGVSPDPVDRLARFREEHDLEFPLLSDPDHEMAAAYGAWGIKKNYGREYEGLIRSTFIVGPDGRIEHAWYNVRAKGHAERVAGTVTG